MILLHTNNLQKKRYRLTLVPYTLVWIFFIVLIEQSCTSGKPDLQTQDTPTRGDINLVADESYSYILEDLKFLFENDHAEAKLNIFYSGEDDVLNQVVDDSVRMAIVSVNPGNFQLAHFKRKGITYFVNHIANDAVILICNKDRKLDKLTIFQLKQLFNSKIQNWGQLEGGANDEKIKIGFPVKGSGIISYMRNKFVEDKKPFPNYCGTFTSTKQLLDTLAIHKQLIGCIGYNYISDKDDSICRYIKKNYKILAVQSTIDTSQFVLPSQSSIGDSSYFLHRKILLINKEGKSGLGTGFAIFISSSRGQRTILKSGLVPARIPAREIKFIRKKLVY